MANSTKLEPFFQKIDGKIINNWKETITHRETIRERLEEALRDNTQKHGKKLAEELMIKFGGKNN